MRPAGGMRVLKTRGLEGCRFDGWERRGEEREEVTLLIPTPYTELHDGLCFVWALMLGYYTGSWNLGRRMDL